MIPRNRTGLVHGALVVFALLIVGRALHVQIVQHGEWTARAERQQVASDTLPAPRGAIVDATGRVLAESRQVVRLAVAPKQVRNLRVLRRLLTTAGVPAAVVRRATNARNAWVELPGAWQPSDAAPLLGLRGVHASPSIERVYASAEGTRRLVGTMGHDGNAAGGIELALDSVLTGVAGRQRRLRDNKGRAIESPGLDDEPPVAGNTVVLTLDHDLQDIAQFAIGEAVAATGASGGDIVVLDPHDGEIRALASRRRDRDVSGVPAFSDTYEPGSTIKPFIAARLLATRRTRVDEVIATYDGAYRAPGRRSPIRDVHRESAMTVADIMRYSSNVGIVRLAERMTAAEQYEALRDAGFGMATGVPFPSEAAGRLPMPHQWSLTTPAALAMGYEVAVTPLQLAMAYGAIANGGELLEPALVKEIRTPDDRVIYQHERRVVRRIMPADVAETMRTLLASVVDSGTATDAQLATYSVGGKSGTARLSAGRGYEGGAYTASFVAFFPADAPQLVVLVKLDRPQGVYYGGRTAGPVSKAVIEAALAAGGAAMDRGDLARRARPLVRVANADEPASVAPVARSDVADDAPSATVAAFAADVEPAPAPSVTFRLASDDTARRAAPVGERVVPSVEGLPTRAAIRRLHAAGFQVRLAKGVRGTAPAAGARAPAGSVVRLGAR